jgi:hypothetical protein
MALVDPNIAMSYRGIELPNQLAQYGQMQQIQAAQNQNRMADLQMQEYERARTEEEGVRNYLSGADLTSPETRAGLARFGKTGLGYSKALTDQETAALTRQKTQLEVDAKKFENQNKQLDFVWNGVGASATPQDAINYITQGVKDGNLSMVQGSAEINRLQNISEGDFRKYKIEKVLGVLDAKEKLAQFKQTTRDTDLGGYIERRIEDAQGNVIGTPQRLNKTPTISEQTGQGNLALSQQKFEYEKGQKPPKLAGPDWKYDAGSDTWVKPPTEENPMGVATPSLAKVGALNNIKYLAEKFLGNQQAPGLVDTTTTGGYFGVKGALAGGTQSAKAFDNAKEQLSTEMRKIFRIPGEGALSDKEQAQYGIQLPKRENNAELNKQIIQDLMFRSQNAVMPSGSLGEPPRGAVREIKK